MSSTVMLITIMFALLKFQFMFMRKQPNIIEFAQEATDLSVGHYSIA